MAFFKQFVLNGKTDRNFLHEKKPPFQDGFEKGFWILCIIEMNRHKKAPEGGER
jgi:hypothetical protein